MKTDTGTKGSKQQKGVGSAKKDRNDWKSKALIRKYTRDAPGAGEIRTRGIRHKNLRKTLEEHRARDLQSAVKTAATEILLPGDVGGIQTNHGEKVYKLKQKDILENVDLNTSKNAIDFQLTKFGPYRPCFSGNGRFLLFGGEKGHVATYDCQQMKIGMELQLEEEVHDVQYLHNETLFAVAQRQFTYIYDHHGVEIHCMRKHERPYRLQFLPYHFLLNTVGHSGWIKWHDISIGQYVAGFPTGMGPCKVLKQNPANAVSIAGHSNGVVTLWSPASSKPLVSLFCHRAPVTDVAVDRAGVYMTTAGLDGFMKVWDLRKFQDIHTFRYKKPITSLDISETGMIGFAMGRKMQVLRNAFTHPKDSTYLEHEIRTPDASLSSGGGAAAATRALKSSVCIAGVKFRPLEDVLCAGHSHGISTMIVPGSGEANFDSFENNPFSNLKQRRETEVQKLLGKLSHEMIGLDAAFVGTVGKEAAAVQAEQKALMEAANTKGKDKKAKKRMRGRNKISAVLRRKQKNVIDAQVVKLREKEKEVSAAATAATAAALAAKNKNKNSASKNNKATTADASAGGIVGVSTMEGGNFDALSRFAKS